MLGERKVALFNELKFPERLKVPGNCGTRDSELAKSCK